MEYINQWPPLETSNDNIELLNNETIQEVIQVKKRKIEYKEDEEVLENVSKLLVRWWRTQVSEDEKRNLPTVQSKSVHAKIQAISKRTDARKFLESLVHKLSSSASFSSSSSTQSCAKLYTLTTVHQIMRNDEEALNWANACLKSRNLRHLHDVKSTLSNLSYIKGLSANDIEILRVATLAFLQVKANQPNTSGDNIELTDVNLKVDVVHANNLTPKAFKEKYLIPRRPVVIEGLSLNEGTEIFPPFVKQMFQMLESFYYFYLVLYNPQLNFVKSTVADKELIFVKNFGSKIPLFPEIPQEILSAQCGKTRNSLPRKFFFFVKSIYSKFFSKTLI